MNHNTANRESAQPQRNRLTEVSVVAIFAILCALFILPSWRDERMTMLREQRGIYSDISHATRTIAFSVLEMRAAVRGYLLSQRPEFRQEYVEAHTRFVETSTELEAAVAQQENVVLREDYAALERMVAAWHEGHLTYLIGMIDRGEIAAAQAYFASGVGQMPVASFQTQLERLQTTAHGHETAIRTEMSAFSDFVVLLNNGLLVLVLAAMALVAVGYGKQRQMNRALSAADAANTELSTALAAQLETIRQHNAVLAAGQRLMAQLPLLQDAPDALQRLAQAVAAVYDLPIFALWVDGDARTGVAAQQVMTGTAVHRDTEVLPRLVPAAGANLTQPWGGVEVIYVPIENGGHLVGTCALGFPSTVAERVTIQQHVTLMIEHTLLVHALRRQEERLTAVFTHAPLGFVLTDASGSVLLSNDAARVVLPWLRVGADACTPHPDAAFYAFGGTPIAADALPLARAVATGVGQRGEILHEIANERIPVRHDVVVVPQTGYLWVLEDTRLLNELEHMKGSFISMIRHELRAPLVTILGVTTMALRSAAPPALATQLDVIEAQALRLQSFIDALLHAADIERDGMVLQRAVVDLQAILTRVINRGAGWKLRCRLTVLQNADVWVDSGRIEQVCVDVIDNALRYGGDGPVEITIGPIEPTEQLLLLRVRDYGQPLSAPEYARVFERFYQVAHERNAGGLGLSMAMCQLVMQAHEGTITIGATAAGDGTEVVIGIPLADRQQSGQMGSVVGGFRVLVVDGDDERSRLLTATLHEIQGNVELVTTMHDAYQRLERQQYDLIVLEVLPVDGDGIAAVRHIRTWQQTPIVMLAKHAAERTIEDALRAGVDEFLIDPIRSTECALRVQNLLRRSGGAVPMATHLRVGNVVAHLAQKQLEVGGVVVDVTPTEFRLFVVCARHLGQIMTHERLLSAVWGDRYDRETQYLWVHMSHVRRKLVAAGATGVQIETVRSVGYRMLVTNT